MKYHQSKLWFIEFMKGSIISASAVFSIALTLPSQAALDIPVKVFEDAGKGDITAEPVTLVFPLPDQLYTSTSNFTLTDDQGKAVPAQFAPLTYWRGNDVYIQHLVVNTQVDIVSAGSRIYHLKEGVAAAPVSPIQVLEDSSGITVTTGTFNFTVRKKGFNLFDRVILDGKSIIAPSAQNGGVMLKRDSSSIFSSGNANVRATVEERGPMRAVISIFGETTYKTRDDFTPGFRCRIYAFAGKPYVKIDFALRNSPHGDSKDPAGPVYFKDFSLEHVLNLGNNVATMVGDAAGPALATSVTAFDDTKKVPGWIDIFDGTVGVMASIRYFWQQYPMDTRYVSGQKMLKLGLWPQGGRDYYYPVADQDTRTYADVYWLDDGMQKTHQVLYYFHNTSLSTTENEKRSALFERPPIGHVDLAVWNKNHTLPDGGFVTPATSGAYSSRGTPSYGKNNFNGSTDRRTTNGTGGLPESGLHFIATGDPQAYFEWESHYLMETDVRYVHMDNLMVSPADSQLDLATNQYSGYHYKDPHYWETHAEAQYLPNTGMRFGAWDTQHMWIYSFYEMYLVNGDYRIRDFYEDLGAFMLYELTVREPMWNRQWGGVPPCNGRAAAHPLGAVNCAFRVTGDQKYRQAASSWVNRAFDWFDHADGTWTHIENVPFMEGFFARALINYVQDSKPVEETTRQKAISLISAFNDAALKWSWVPGKGYGYQHWDTATTYNTGASVSSVVLGDPAAWLYLTTGSPKYRDSLHVYMKTYPEYFTNWNGDYTGRISTYMDQVGISDTTLPAAISDLSLSSDSRLTFTSPGGSGFVVRWYYKPITDTYFALFNNDTTSQISWWAANISPSLEVPASTGTRQTIDIYDLPVGAKMYATVKVIGKNGVWSRESNIASATITMSRSSMALSDICEKKYRPVFNGMRILVNSKPHTGITIRLVLPNNEDVHGEIRLALVNLAGRIVKVSPLNSPFTSKGGMIQWEPTGITSGVYVLTVRSMNQVIRKPLFIAQ